ncbi:MAG: hypothetical protein D6729_18380 [Deltaproteobacteria bacterium]|nr:MAG: hypothetical protein D6729_18380 [Deltaproteobacteria bacterium]
MAQKTMFPPDDATVDVATLSATFRNTTTSYKFLFFFSLLDHIKAAHQDTGNPEGEIEIEWDSIAAHMLAHAWYPLCTFNLTFGSQDKTRIYIESIREYVDTKSLLGDPRKTSRLARRIKGLLEEKRDIEARDLMRWVPYRWLAPFARLRPGMPDTKKNKAIKEFSCEAYRTGQVPYKILDTGLRIHPTWRSYFFRHLSVLYGWAAFHWVEYLQKRNPHALGLSSKLFPEDQRRRLADAKTYWETAFEGGLQRICFYTGDRLSRYALDHFIPWSFIAHDQVWNIVPCTPSVNSSKGDRIPPDHLLPKLADVQAAALSSISRSGKLGMRKWEKVVEPFIATLGVPRKDLVPHPIRQEELASVLRSTFTDKLKPLLETAHNQGFENWKDDRITR